MRMYKKFGTAVEKARNTGQPLIKVGQVWLVGDPGELTSTTQIALVDPESGGYTATVGLGHLERLGNANHAKEDPKPYGPGYRKYYHGVALKRYDIYNGFSDRRITFVWAYNRDQAKALAAKKLNGHYCGDNWYLKLDPEEEALDG